MMCNSRRKFPFFKVLACVKAQGLGKEILFFYLLVEALKAVPLIFTHTIRCLLARKRLTLPPEGGEDISFSKQIFKGG